MEVVIISVWQQLAAFGSIIACPNTRRLMLTFRVPRWHTQSASNDSTMAESGAQDADLYQELCAAVQTMFQGHDAREQRKANDFLVSFRRSERAWDLCLLIVSQDGYESYELAMFASQTLAQLARKSMSLPRDHFTSSII